MSRMMSLNYHLEVGHQTIHCRSIGEFGPGEEGRIEASDGTRKYRVRDNIWDIGEIEVSIYLRDNFDSDEASEFSIMEDWCNNNRILNVYIIGTDITGTEKAVWLCSQCELAKGKKNAFDRNSKDTDSVMYYILPQNVELISGVINPPLPIGPDFNAGR